MNHPLVLAMTGASGAVYAMRLLEVLARAGRDVHVTISPAAQLVLEQELQLRIDLAAVDFAGLGFPNLQFSPRFKYHHFQNFMAPMASGSFLTAGMIICPCSGSTLGAIAHGTGNNLIHRAAEVHLKERRKLVLVPRETPLSVPMLDNMKRLAELGAVILPAMPGWYHGVSSVQDLIDFVVARILDQMGIEHTLIRRWGSDDGTK